MFCCLEVTCTVYSVISTKSEVALDAGRSLLPTVQYPFE